MFSCRNGGKSAVLVPGEWIIFTSGPFFGIPLCLPATARWCILGNLVKIGLKIGTSGYLFEDGYEGENMIMRERRMVRKMPTFLLEERKKSRSWLMKGSLESEAT